MEYFILEKKEIIETVTSTEGTQIVEHGRIDLQNLGNSHGDSYYLFDIPPDKQKELNEKGETSFTMLITRTVMVNKHNTEN